MKMKKQKLKADFDPKYLDKLVNDEGSCVHILKSKHHLALHPYHLNDLNTSVKEILNKGIAKYNTELDGILFGYNNIKFLSRLGHIVDDSCFIHVDIEADFYIFKPVVGQTLQGVVKKKSKDHVGCLVHKIFNVSLPKPKKDDDWIGNSIRLNSEVLLTVTHTDFGGKLPYIKGKIESILSEPAIDESENNITPLGNGKMAKKGKKIRFGDDSEVLDETVEELETPKRKRKKSKSDTFDNTQEEEMESPKKKRKKSKSETLNNTEEEMDTPKKKRKKSESETFDNAQEEEIESPRKKRKKSKSETYDYTEEEVEPPKKKRNKSGLNNTEEEVESVKKKSKKSKKSDTSADDL